MDGNDYLMQQFLTLRDEIKAIKSRIFWIVAMGLFGVPVIMYLAESIERAQFMTPMIPYVIVVLIVMFIAEHSALMRAGQYVRLNIEPQTDKKINWETWLESHPGVRLLDKHFFAVFVLVFFVYYFMSIGFAVQRLMGYTAEGTSQTWWLIAAIVTYGIGAIWALSTLLHHWKSATGTSGDE